MDEGLVVKSNARAVLEKQLAARAKMNQFGIVVVGSGTDAYIHHEEKLKMTEGMLKLLLKYRFPVFISTKCNLIRRDFELLKQINENAILPDDLKDKLPGGVILSVSISTLDEKIANSIEPGAIPPEERLALVSEMKDQGFLAGVNAIPLLPFISDTEEEMDKIIKAVKESGADYILTGGLTLFGDSIADSKTLYYKFLRRYDPSLLKLYEHLYGSNFYTPFSYQDQLKERATRLCKKYNIRNSIIE